MGFGDGEQHSVVEFHIFVVKADGPAIIDARHFHPDQIVGVVDDPHLVGFGVADADRSWCGLVGGHGLRL